MTDAEIIQELRRIIDGLNQAIAAVRNRIGGRRR